MSDDSEYANAPSFFTVYPSVALPMFLAIIDQTIVATALPAIARSLGSVERVSWVVIAYLISTTIAAPVYGKLRDTIGSRTMMLVALAFFLSASLVCASANSMEVLVVGRILQGLGGGGLMTLSQALIGETIPPRMRARYQGYLASIAVTSSILGPVLGGILTEWTGWRSIFLVNVPLGLVAVLLTLRLPARPVTHGHRGFDVLGLAYLIGFIVPLLLAVEQFQAVKWSAVLVALALLCVSMLSGFLLVRREGRTPNPLLEMDLLRQPAVWRSDAMAATHGATLVSLITFLPIYVYIHYGMGASQTGLLLVPMMIGIGTGSMLTGRIVGRIGWTMIFPSWGLAGSVLLLGAIAVWGEHMSARTLVFVLIVLGLTLGTVMGVVQVTVQNAAGKASLGAAAASVQVSRALGATIGTAIIGGVLFAVLALAAPDTLELFKALIQKGAATPPPMAPTALAAAKAEIMQAFRAAFLMITLFAATTLVLAITHPVRRI